MRTIENYYDFFSAMRDKQSEDRVVRNEAKNALGNFHIRDPKRFEEFKAQYEGITPQYTIIPQKLKTEKKPKKPTPKYPELSEQEIREKARQNLIKGSCGYGLHHDLPNGITVEDVLISFDKLQLSDLITKGGNLVQRKTLLRKCIKLAASEGRVDENKLRTRIIGWCKNYYSKADNIYKPPFSFAAMSYIIKLKTNAEEIADIYDDGRINFGSLVCLAKKKGIDKLPAEEIQRFEAEEAAKKAAKEAKREAYKAHSKDRREAGKEKTEAVLKEAEENKSSEP